MEGGGYGQVKPAYQTSPDTRSADDDRAEPLRPSQRCSLLRTHDHQSALPVHPTSLPQLVLLPSPLLFGRLDSLFHRAVRPISPIRSLAPKLLLQLPDALRNLGLRPFPTRTLLRVVSYSMPVLATRSLPLASNGSFRDPSSFAVLVIGIMRIARFVVGAGAVRVEMRQGRVARFHFERRGRWLMSGVALPVRAETCQVI
jgi:hypothetical protein